VPRPCRPVLGLNLDVAGASEHRLTQPWHRLSLELACLRYYGERAAESSETPPHHPENQVDVGVHAAPLSALWASRFRRTRADEGHLSAFARRPPRTPSKAPSRLDFCQPEGPLGR